jgi:plastocyanin
MMAIRLGRALLLMSALVFSSASLAAGKAHQVAIEGMKFVPERIEVAPGDTITWTNRDLVPHTVTAGKSVESGSIPPNGTWRYVVREKGEIDYICRFHPLMRGKIVVK